MTEVAVASRPMIEIERLHKHFGSLHVLRGIDLSVAVCEVVCIIGPSGSGKSTLLRCINQLEVAEQGRRARREEPWISKDQPPVFLFLIATPQEPDRRPGQS